MKCDLRISVKDYRRDRNLKVQLAQVPFAGGRQFWVRMNGQPWPKAGQPVSLTRVLTALRKALVRAQAPAPTSNGCAAHKLTGPAGPGA